MRLSPDILNYLPQLQYYVKFQHYICISCSFYPNIFWNLLDVDACVCHRPAGVQPLHAVIKLLGVDRCDCHLPAVAQPLHAIMKLHAHHPCILVFCCETWIDGGTGCDQSVS